MIAMFVMLVMLSLAQPGETPTVSAADLYQQFKDNAAKAKQDWDDKPVQVTGHVHRVRREFLGDNDVMEFRRPGTKTGLLYPQCYFSDAKELLSLKAGEAVTLKGVVTFEKSGKMTLKKCTIVK